MTTRNFKTVLEVIVLYLEENKFDLQKQGKKTIKFYVFAIAVDKLNQKEKAKQRIQVLL